MALHTDAFRRFHQRRGRAFRHWRAFVAAGQNRNGKQFVETVVPPTERAFFGSTQQDVELASYGLIAAGTTTFSSLPDICDPLSGDYILDADPGQWRRAEAVITRGVSDTDPLPERFVRQIVEVRVDGVLLPLGEVEAVSADSPDDDDLSGIRFLNDVPVGTKVFVLYRYSRFYICLGESMQGEPTGSDGKRLPQRVLLRREGN